MKRTTVLALALAASLPLAAGADPEPSPDTAPVVLAGITEPSKDAMQRLERYYARPTTFLRDWTADGSALLVALPEALGPQLHRIDRPQSKPVKVASLPCPVGKTRASRPPAARFVVFSTDLGTPSGAQLYRLDLPGGGLTQLTSRDRLHRSYELARDGQVLVIASERVGAHETEILAMDPMNPAGRRSVYKAAGYAQVEDISPDGRRALLLMNPGTGGTTITEIELSTGKATFTTPARATRPPTVLTPRYVAGGGAFVATSDDHGDVRRLVRVELADGAETPLTGDLNADVEVVEVHPSGQLVAFTTNAGGTSHVYFLDLQASTRAAPMATLPLVISKLRFDPAGFRLAAEASLPRSPAQVIVFGGSNGRAIRWSAPRDLSPEAKAGDPSLVTYGTFRAADGRSHDLTALVTRPRSATGKLPVVVIFHDGPAAQWRPAYNPLATMLADELSAAVVQPNLRGAGGFGLAFRSADDGEKRAGVLDDVGALLDWVGAQPDLDAGRVGVVGGFYGGLVALNALARFPDRLAAGVVQSAIVDLPGYVARAPASGRDAYRAEFGDAADPRHSDFLDTLSPSAVVSRIRAPVLVMHGALDPRVPLSHALALVNELSTAKRQPALLVAKQEGHGFAGERSQMMAGFLAVKFLKEKLLVQ